MRNGLESKPVAGTFTLLPTEDVVIGAGCISQLGSVLARYGVERALLVTGTTLATKTDLVERVRAEAGGRIAAVFSGSAQHVPREAVLEATRAARGATADAVISFGGGSPNDTAKATVLALADGLRTAADFDAKMIRFEYPHVTAAPPIEGAAVPLFAIPTTLSAGEFTHFAGVTDAARKVKDLYIDKKMAAKVVFLDPELTLATPQWLWLSSGMRSVDHCVEALCSTTAHPFTDALAARALQMLDRFLRASRDDPADLAARSQLMTAAWMSVCGLANVTLGLSHGIGHQLGARCAVPHGVTSCVMMHHAMRFNAGHTAARQAWIAELLGVDVAGLDEAQAAEAAAAAIERLTLDLGQPARLRDAGVEPDVFEAIAADAMQDMIVATNPRPVRGTADVVALLHAAY